MLSEEELRDRLREELWLAGSKLAVEVSLHEGRRRRYRRQAVAVVGGAVAASSIAAIAVVGVLAVRGPAMTADAPALDRPTAAQPDTSPVRTAPAPTSVEPKNFTPGSHTDEALQTAIAAAFPGLPAATEVSHSEVRGNEAHPSSPADANRWDVVYELAGGDQLAVHVLDSGSLFSSLCGPGHESGADPRTCGAINVGGKHVQTVEWLSPISRNDLFASYTDDSGREVVAWITRGSRSGSGSEVAEDANLMTLARVVVDQAVRTAVPSRAADTSKQPS